MAMTCVDLGKLGNWKIEGKRPQLPKAYDETIIWKFPRKLGVALQFAGVDKEPSRIPERINFFMPFVNSTINPMNLIRCDQY